MGNSDMPLGANPTNLQGSQSQNLNRGYLMAYSQPSPYLQSLRAGIVPATIKIIDQTLIEISSNLF
jgi:hypothetical protein